MNFPQSQASAPDFDLAGEVFTAQSQRPASLAPVDVSTLSPFQRALLVIDGTVTWFIEAYTNERVEIRRLAQARSVLAADDPWLQAPAGETVIERQVLLCGLPSGRCHAWAESRIAAARLPAAAREALDREPGGIGRILVDAALETRRECLWFGRSQRSDVPEPVAAGMGTDFLMRTYRVIAGGHALMVISEHFPFQQPLIAALD